MLSRQQGEAIVTECCREFPAAFQLRFLVRERQEEIYGREATQTAVGVIHGGFHPGRGIVSFATASFRDEAHLRRTFRHEIIGHYGINTHSPGQKRRLLAAIEAASSIDPRIASLWRKIEKHYPNHTPSQRAEEVYCFVAETVNGTDQTLNERGAAALQALNHSSLRPMTYDDLTAINSMVAAGLRSNTRPQQIFPSSDDAQFQKELTMATAKKAFHEEVAERLIAQLEAGTAPWQKPWDGSAASGFVPQNPTTGKRYKGINALVLMMEDKEDPRWMTYKQAQSVGAQVRKGETGTSIQYWKFEDTITKRDESGKPVKDDKGNPVKVRVRLDRPKVFFSKVFNADQIDGLEPYQAPEIKWNPVERVENLLQASGADIRHLAGDRAYYSPIKDHIVLPERSQFENMENYYEVALHELGHWTGHPSRLDRDLSHPFGSEGYAKEELRAEIYSMMAGQEYGVAHNTDSHAAYVKSWIKVLKEDPLEIFRASSDAEKILDFVQSLEQKQVQEQDVKAQHEVTLEKIGQSLALNRKDELGKEDLDALAVEHFGFSFPQDWAGATFIDGPGAQDDDWQIKLMTSDGQEVIAGRYPTELEAVNTAIDLTAVALEAEPNPANKRIIELNNMAALERKRDHLVSEQVAQHGAPDTQQEALSPQAEATLRVLSQHAGLHGVTVSASENHLDESGTYPCRTLEYSMGGEKLVVTTELSIRDGKALTSLNGQRLSGTNYSADSQYQEQALGRALNAATVQRIAQAEGKPVYQLAKEADDAYQAALVEHYGEARASDARYLYQHDDPAVSSAQRYLYRASAANVELTTNPPQQAQKTGVDDAYTNYVSAGEAWTGDFQIRAVIERGGEVIPANDAEPDFYGVYAQNTNGLHLWIGDYETEQAAQVAVAEITTIETLTTLGNDAGMVPAVSERMPTGERWVTYDLFDKRVSLLGVIDEEGAGRIIGRVDGENAESEATHNGEELRAAFGQVAEAIIPTAAAPALRLKEAAAALGVEATVSTSDSVGGLKIEYSRDEYPLPIFTDIDGSGAAITMNRDNVMGAGRSNDPEEQEAAMTEAVEQSEQQKDVRTERVYIDVPYAQKQEAKAAGAKWDGKQRSWYVPPGLDMAQFSKWDTGATPSRTPGRDYLAVPYDDRNEAKAAGAKWDRAAKAWYAGPDADTAALAKWRPDSASLVQEAAQSPQDEFTDAMRSLGLVVSDPHPIMDGKKHRIAAEGDKKGEKAGFYVGHLDGHPAGYILNNRTGQDMRWKSKGYSLSPEEKAKLAAEAAEKLQRRAQEQEAVHETTAVRVATQLKSLTPVAGVTPYLKSKGIEAAPGIFTDKDSQTTYIPAHDVNGKHWTTQYINAEGRKRFAKDSLKEGNFHVVGGSVKDLASLPAIVIGEGYATASSNHDALKFPTVAAFDSGNVEAVASVLRERYPNKPILITGDDDRWQKDGLNPGRKHAEAAAEKNNAVAIFPVFAPGEAHEDNQLTDFNDLASKSELGKSAVKRQLEDGLQKAKQKQVATEQQTLEKKLVQAAEVDKKRGVRR